MLPAYLTIGMLYGVFWYFVLATDEDHKELKEICPNNGFFAVVAICAVTWPVDLFAYLFGL